MKKYFAFGSNMNPSQMKDRVGEVPASVPAVLTGYQLVFNKWSQTRKGWAANLIPTDNQNDKVEGVVYQLSEAQISKLDKNEGYNPDRAYNPKGYRRQQLSVTIPGQGEQMVETYITDNHEIGDACKPTLNYIQNFLEARASYSESWYNKLLDIPLHEGGTARTHLRQTVASSRNNNNSSNNELENVFLDGKQLGALYKLTMTSDAITPKMLDTIKNPDFRNENKKTCAVFEVLCSAYQKHASYSVLSDAAKQQQLEDALRNQEVEIAIALLAHGAQLTEALASIARAIADKTAAGQTLNLCTMAFCYKKLRTIRYSELQEVSNSFDPSAQNKIDISPALLAEMNTLFSNKKNCVVTLLKEHSYKGYTVVKRESGKNKGARYELFQIAQTGDSEGEHGKFYSSKGVIKPVESNSTLIGGKIYPSKKGLKINKNLDHGSDLVLECDLFNEINKNNRPKAERAYFIEQQSGWVDDCPEMQTYMVMKKFDGITFYEFMKNYQHFDAKTLYEVIISILDTFINLAKINYVHTDANPGNIILNLDTKIAKLIDFDSDFIDFFEDQANAARPAGIKMSRPFKDTILYIEHVLAAAIAKDPSYAENGNEVKGKEFLTKIGMYLSKDHRNWAEVKSMLNAKVAALNTERSAYRI